MAHRCCWWLELRRGAIAIAAFYVCYLLLLTLTLTVLAIVYSGETPLAGYLGMAAGGLLLLALLAGALLLGATRHRRPLLLIWLLTYGAVLLAMTLSMVGLAIAAETGQQNFLTEFCKSRPGGRCPFRLFKYTLLMFAMEWYFWAVVLLRYREMGRQELADQDGTQPPGVMVRGAHNGQMQQVPVAYYGDGALLSGDTPTGTTGYAPPAAYAPHPLEPANQGRHMVVLRGC